MTRLPGPAQSVVAFNVGLWLGGQGQSLRRLYRRRVHGLSVDQPVEQVQNMRLGRRASLQRQFDGREHSLLVVLENQGQNLDHLAVAAWRLEHALLQSLEGRRKFGEGRAVTQGSGLALYDRQIMPPIKNGGRALALVRAGEDADVLAHDLPFGGDDNTLGIDPHADWAIGERGRHAVAVAVEMD